MTLEVPEVDGAKLESNIKADMYRTASWRSRGTAGETQWLSRKVREINS